MSEDSDLPRLVEVPPPVEGGTYEVRGARSIAPACGVAIVAAALAVALRCLS